MSVAVSPPLARQGCDLDCSTFGTLVAELGIEDTLEMFFVFFTEADKRLMRLRGLAHDDRETIAQEAHGLKGSAGNFGLPHVAELAAVLEQDAQTLTPARYETALRALATSYAAAREQFAKLAG